MFDNLESACETRPTCESRRTRNTSVAGGGGRGVTNNCLLWQLGQNAARHTPAALTDGGRTNVQ